MITPTPTSSATTVDRLQPLGREYGEQEVEEEEGDPAPLTPPQYMNSAALSEIAGELLVTVRELREELLQVGGLEDYQVEYGRLEDYQVE